MRRRNMLAAGIGCLTILNVVAVAGASHRHDPDCTRHVVTIGGTIEDDVIQGTPGDYVISPGAGDDTIFAGGGHDLICAGRGNDDVRGGPGNDRIYGGSGDDEVQGHAGRDDLFGDVGDDSVMGHSGSDIVRGGPENHEGRDDDQVSGGLGDDFILDGAGSDDLSGGPGSDWLAYRSAVAVISLADGFSISDNDHLDRLERIENVYGDWHEAPAEEIDPVIVGTDGPNILVGGIGGERILGRGGDDVLDGNCGDDVLDGGDGGRDVAAFRSDASVTADLETGTALGSCSRDVMRDVEGLAASPSLGGNALYGSGDDDLLRGGALDDFLVGRAGDDLLIGAGGRDLGYGEAGSDRCVDVEEPVTCEDGTEVLEERWIGSLLLLLEYERAMEMFVGIG